MPPLYDTFLSWSLAFVFLLNRVFRIYVSVSPHVNLTDQISGESNEITNLIDNKHGVFARLPPEVTLLILRNLPYHVRPRLDLFASVVSASCTQRPRSLDVAALSAPLICSSWRGPGTEALYERITLYTEAQCVLLHRTLQNSPSLRPLVRFLRLPSPREKPVVTPPSVSLISADIVGACTHVQEVDVLQKNDFPFNLSSVPYLRSLRVSNASAQPTIYNLSLSIRFPVLQELTLNGYPFGGENARIDAVWPELPQLKSLRLEKCGLEGEDLTQLLSRTTTKLQSLALFSVRHPFSNNELPSFLADSLEKLWLEDCWPLSFESHFTSYSSLRSLHLDWHLFAKVVPFVPPNLLSVSVTIPGYVGSSAPDYDRFETELERLSINLPSLRVIQVLGQHGFQLLNHEAEIRRKLGLRDVRLVVELVHRGEARRLRHGPRPKSPTSPEAEWHEWLYM